MSEITDQPQQDEQFIGAEEQKTIEGNVRLLELKFIESLSREEREKLDEETQQTLLSIKDLGVELISPEVFGHSITIWYDTRTGKIGISGRSLGDSSVLRTSLVERQANGKPTKEILLYRPGNMPSASQYDEILTGIKTGPDLGNRRILPERVSPEQPQLKGFEEIWGQSQFVDSAKGDILMLKTIQTFNQRHGPPH